MLSDISPVKNISHTINNTPAKIFISTNQDLVKGVEKFIKDKDNEENIGVKTASVIKESKKTPLKTAYLES